MDGRGGDDWGDLEKLRGLVYLESLKNKHDTPSKGIWNMLMIEKNLTVSSTSSWVIDSSSSAHFYTSVQGLYKIEHWGKVKCSFKSVMAQELLL